MRSGEIIAMMRGKRPEVGPGVEALSDLCREYPYCASFQVLRAMAAKAEDHIEYGKLLNRAAVAIQDRSKLYDYVVRDELYRTLHRVDRETTEEDAPSETTAPSEPREHPPTATPVREPDEVHTESENRESAPAPEVPSADAERPDEGVQERSDHDPAEPTPIPKDPLEEQVMREAITHLGELEVGRSLTDDAPREEPDEATDPEGEEPPQEPKGPAKPHSFGEWLLSLDADPAPDDRQSEIIGKFIAEEPQISPVKKAFFSPSQMGKMSLVEDETFVTETLAGIYMRQGDYAKAARAYKNLSLKYPEKSVYFADLQKQAEEKLKK